VAFGPDSADPYAPKAVRASMGSIFNVPLTRADVAELPGRTIALDASGPDELCTVMDAYRPRRDTECVTLLVGAERHGLPAEILAAADTVARIPTQIHSLNAAMAATIALYELTRPRDRAGDRRMPRG
jgi:TrmH family RNA methyltransferase